MPSFRTGAVTRLLEERPGLQRVEVDGEKAYVLTALIGGVDIGDRVVVNTTAVELGLGTGGWHVVHWNLSRDRWRPATPGHIMKLRYTSLQLNVDAAEEQLPDQTELPDIGGMPVVACALHSQVAAVAAAFKHLRPDRRLVYVMTDGGALPLALSDLVFQLRSTGLIDATVTAGHAFGGDHETVTIASGLHVAREVADADAVVAGIGPGAVGTGTPLGHSGLDVATIVDAAAQLGGAPIVAVRFSGADERERHRGVSHHTAAALRMAGAAPVTPEPDENTPDAPALLAARGITVKTMGRGSDRDPEFFAYAAAAGVAAARSTVR